MDKIRESIQWRRSFSSGYSVGIIGTYFVTSRIQIPQTDIDNAEMVLAAHSIVVDALWRDMYGEIDCELDRLEGAIMRNSSLDLGEVSEPLLIARKLRKRIQKLKR